MRNVGDDVLLYVTLAEVARVDREASFTIISKLPEAIPPGVRVTITPGCRRFESVRQLMSHDAWLFGGGGLLQDGAERSRQYLIRLDHTVRVAKLMRRKILMLGIGIGPLTTSAGRTAAASLLQQADLVTVRDEESRVVAAELAPDVPVHLAGDLAFLLPRHTHAPAVTHSGRPKTLGISLLPYAASLGRSSDEDQSVAATFATALNQAMASHPDWRVMLFEFFSGWQKYRDASVLRSLERQLTSPGRVAYRRYTGDFEAVYADIAACSAFVGMRFHSCLLAHLGGVPCLMITHHQKSESLARRLQLSPDAVASLSVIQDTAALTARLDALLTDGDKFRPRVGLDTMARSSARTFDLLTGWLPRRRADTMFALRRTP
jgi:polysaccharide pyruvyl transferase WcaK-like protein